MTRFEHGEPVGITFAPNNRIFVWSAGGKIWVIDQDHPQGTPAPIFDISGEVNRFADRGMLGLALDPNFASNGRIYLFYAYDGYTHLGPCYDPNDSPDSGCPRTARLTRFAVDPNDPERVTEGETVLLGGSKDPGPDNIPLPAYTHSSDSIHFSADGRYLYLSLGDSASPDGADPAAFKSQKLDSYSGKILRVLPDGSAPSDNPFYDGTNSVRSRVYALGLRNPFRFSVDPTSGQLFVGDVGWNTWEEVDKVVMPGQNFGWPCYEGPGKQNDYQNLPPPNPCSQLTAAQVSSPLYTYQHNVGNSITGGVVYTGTQYPQQYRGKYFLGDFGQQWVRFLDGGLSPLIDNAGRVVDLELGPDGALYYVDIDSEEIRRIAYGDAPVAVPTANPTAGLSPLTVQFRSDGSYDPSPNGGIASYHWDFGDGTSSNEANPTHTYVSDGVSVFIAKLKVTSTGGLTSAPVEVKITVGSRPPVVKIVSPPDANHVRNGETFSFSGTASDPDETLPTASLLWQVRLIHNDNHFHPEQSLPGVTSGSFTADFPGDGLYYYELIFSATDSTGLTSSDHIFIYRTLELGNLPTAFVGQGYFANTLTGGRNATVTLNGHVPPGMNFFNGVFFDTPARPIRSFLSLHAQDERGNDAGASASKFYIFNACQSADTPPRTLADATAGASYTESVRDPHDAGLPISYYRTEGKLPAVLTLNSTTGEIIGTPTELGSFSFKIQAVMGTPPRGRVVGPRPPLPGCPSGWELEQEFKLNVNCPEEGCSPQASNFEGWFDGADCETIWGWAWDKTQPDTPISVNIYADGYGQIGTAVAAYPRADLLAAGKGDGNHAFVFPVPGILKDGREHKIHVTSSDGYQELGWSPRSISCTVPPQYEGAHVANSCDHIDGWAMDATRPNTPVDVQIYDGSNLLTTLSANIGSDLVPSAAGHGNGKHGFLYYIPEALRGGPRQIRVVFAASGSPLADTDRSLDCPASPVTEPPRFDGFYYHADCSSIGGWAWDINRPNTPVDVNVYADGALLATLSANFFGDDLLAAGKGDGRHRFIHFIPAYLKDSQFHQLRVVYAGTNTELHNGFPDVNLNIRCSPVTEPPVTPGGTPDGQPSANTSTGSGVGVSSGTPYGSSSPLVTATFDNVTSPGVTTFTPVDPQQIGTLPDDYAYPFAPLSPEVFEISTTATVSGSITLRFNVAAENSQAEFSRLRVLHKEDGVWVDRTVLTPDQPAPDFTSRTLTARVSSLSPFVIARLIGDEAPPSTTATTVSLSQPANGNGWHNQDVTVALTAGELAGSTGVRQITFSAAGAQNIPATVVSGSTAQLVVTNEGVTNISYFSTDNAGGAEEEQTLTIRLDKTAPTVTPFATAAGSPYVVGAWTNKSVAVRFECTDGLSGPAQVGDPVTLDGEGFNQSASGRCTDRAGNNADAVFGGINIDKTPPVVLSSRAPQANAYGWNSTDVVAAYTASDALSGLAPNSPPSGSFAFTNEGANQSHTFTVSDVAGNSSTVSVDEVNIDKTAPTVTARRTTPANAQGWNNTDVNASYSAADNLSGFVPGTESGVFTFTAEGANQSQTFNVSDLAGNVGTVTFSGVSIDKTAPAISASRTPEGNSFGWNKTDVTADYSASDELSGLAAGSPEAGSFVFNSEGAHQSHTFTVADVAGNSASVTLNEVNIDKSPPVISAKPDRAANAHGWYSADVTVTPAASDALSGLNSMPGSKVLGEGADQTVTFTVEDLAGNSASTTVSGISIDKTPPTIGAARTPDANNFGWNNTDVTARYSADDALSGLLSAPTGTFTFTAEGPDQSHTFTVEDLAGNTSAATIDAVSIDKTAPSISCSHADGTWHAADVTLPCTAADSLSSLLNAADGAFTLQTSVANGVETVNASTDTRGVCDRAGNCAVAGPINGNQVDKKPPDISITSPLAADYLLRQPVLAAYSCADGGSGAGGCIGTVSSGSAIDTETLGPKVFTVQAVDRVGNASNLIVNYTVGYKIRALYDEGKAYRSGSTVPVKLQLCDFNGTNLSTPSVVVTALGTSRISDYAPGQLEDAGNSNPDDNFRFTDFNGAGGYIFNLKTTGLTTGTYVLIFRAGTDPVTHAVQFQIR